MPLSLLGLTLGINSSRMRRQARHSSSLVKTFALISACQICFRNEEIASLLFQMLGDLGLLDNYHESASQLSGPMLSNDHRWTLMIRLGTEFCNRHTLKLLRSSNDSNR